MSPSNSARKLLAGFCLLVVLLGSDPAAAEAVYRRTQSENETLLRPEPMDFRIAARVPPATEVRVIRQVTIEDGPAKVNWYLVEYENKTGWMSGLDFADWEKERTYSLRYDSPLEASKPLMGADF